MLYIIALLAACVAAQRGKKNLSGSLPGALQKGLKACEINAKIQALEAQMEGCGMGADFTVLVTHKKMYHAFHGMNKKKAFFPLMAEVYEAFGIKETMEYYMSFKAPSDLIPAGDNFKFDVFNDADLDTAVDFARAYDFQLKFTLEMLHDFRDPQIRQIIGPISATQDGRDTGTPKDRTMKFTKKEDDTELRVFYHDNAGVTGADKWCRYEIMINGKSCPSQKIAGSIHTIAGEMDRVPIIVAGMCENVPKTEDGKFHTLSIVINGRDKDSNCLTGWQMEGGVRGNYKPGQNFVLEAEEMVIGYQELQYVQGVENTDLNAGRITGSRKLTFDKVEEDTWMRIFWKDNLRKHSTNDCWCRWEVHVDNAYNNCKSSNGVAAHIHARAGDNDHYSKAVVGYCKMSAGEHELTIYINRSNGACNCNTGWGGGELDNYLMEVREINTVGEKITWVQKWNHQDGRDSGYINYRQLPFTKLRDDTNLRLMYSDNLRVYGNPLRKCQWELWINGKSCPSGKIAMSMSTTQNDNDYQPGIVMGYCDTLPAGRHEMRVYLHSADGINNHDCLTGGYWGTPNNYIMEVEEVEPIANDKPPTAAPVAFYKGCKDVKAKLGNAAKSDVYKVNPDGKQIFDAFCDFDTPKGPWMLVASVNEDNIQAHCRAGDRWSYTGGGQTTSKPQGDGTWNNKNTFGNVNNAVKDDYKNPGYWSVEASALMMAFVAKGANNINEAISKTWVAKATTTDVFNAYNPKNMFGLYTKWPPTYNVASANTVRVQAPAEYVKGSASDFAKHTNPNCKSNHNNMAFTTFNCEKGANALCFSRCNTCDHEHNCVGGGGYWPGHSGRLCNDFSGWAWDGDKNALGRGWSNSQKMIESTVMLYYRER